MKKVFFLVCFMMAGTLIFAQDLDDIREVLGKNGWDVAKGKAMIDKYMSNPKNAAKPESWYYKGYIYNAASKNDSLKKSCADCKMEAFEAFKKYQQMDSKNLLMMIEQNVSLFDIYNNYFEAGAKSYNNKEYDIAFTNFEKAGIVQDYIKNKGFDYNGFKFSDFDTALIMNTALSARLAKNEDAGMVYYKKLTGANLSAPQYLEVYEYVAEYYRKKKDEAGLAAALEQGRRLYPQEDYWNLVEIEKVAESGKKDDVFNKYDELLAKNPGNYTLAYNYAVELYNYIYANEDKTIKVTAYKPRLHELLKKVIAIKSSADANLLMARYLYNDSFDKSDEARKIKGAKPEDVKKRKELNDGAAAMMNECIPYAEAASTYFSAQPKLKAVEKANYKSALNILQSIYEAKKDPAKAATYSEKSKAIN